MTNQRKQPTAGSFKQGERPPHWMPLGSERISSEGYLQRKMTDTGSARRDWVSVHILLWEAANGPVKPGHSVVFRNGDRASVTLDNLEMISKAELLQRNSIHRYPAELQELMRLKGLVTRKINALDR